MLRNQSPFALAHCKVAADVLLLVAEAALGRGNSQPWNEKHFKKRAPDMTPAQCAS